MVRDGREAATARPRLHGPLRGRSGHGLRERRRMRAGSWTVLPKRFGEVRSDPPPRQDTAGAASGHVGRDENRRSTSENSSFDFLGFTHYWARVAEGHWVVKRKTAGESLQAGASNGCRSGSAGTDMQPVAWQHEQLVRKLRGHDTYLRVQRQLAASGPVFRYEIGRVWRKWLNRRSDKARMSVGALQSSAEALPTPRAARSATGSGLAQRIRDLTSRMREIRTSGSVGGPGGRPPGPTRQGEASRA